MIYVKKEKGRFPFSRGILARALAPTGIPIERIYEMIGEIQEDLESSGIEVIDSKNLRKRVREKLHTYGYGRLEKYYLASRQVAKLEKPVIILIGGASGVGKSAVSAEIGRRYGIERFIGTDLIREIMRYMMPKEINPILHESTFNADSSTVNPSIEDEVIYSFYEQSRIVCKGVDAYIRRIIKEGLKTVINGVHLIPGLLGAAVENAGSIHLYHYVLHIEDEEEHKHRFHLRAEGTRRDPNRYIGNIDKIRRIQDYYTEAAEKEGVKTVENSDFENTVETIFKDITQRLGEEIINKKEGS
jgi:2-phosphoglycerate kinase